jgi:hypothetical protein
MSIIVSKVLDLDFDLGESQAVAFATNRAPQQAGSLK